MVWFANLRVRTKVVVAFALVLTVTCGLGLFSLQRLSTVDDREWVVAALLLATSLCVAAGYLLIVEVSTPIRKMTDAMDSLAQHKLDTVIEGIGRADEVGRMASAVQTFKNIMIESDRLKAEQEEIARRADIEKRELMERLASDFEASIGGVVQAVATQATQMESSAQTMSAAAEETSKQASAVAAASEQSSANVQTVASATEELSSSISEIGRHRL